MVSSPIIKPCTHFWFASNLKKKKEKKKKKKRKKKEKKKKKKKKKEKKTINSIPKNQTN